MQEAGKRPSLFLGWLTETGAQWSPSGGGVEMLERLWYDGEEGFQNKNQNFSSPDRGPRKTRPHHRCPEGYRGGACWCPGTVDPEAVLFVRRRQEDAAVEACALTAVKLTDQLFLKGQSENTGKNKWIWKPEDG